MHGLMFSISQHSYASRSLGGHRIAHYLREQGWDIEVVDWANWWSIAQLKEFFQSRYTSKTVFVAFTHLFSMWSPVMEEFAGWIKENYPHLTLISGSAVNPMFETKHIDYYIQGYGEYAMVELLKYVTGNGKRPIFNLNAPNGKKIISAIHSYPAYPMSSLMMRYEDRDYIEPNEWLTVETGRGCMFSCSFCNFPIIGVKTDHTRDASDFNLQLQDTHDRFGVSSYIIADDTFNDRTDKIIKFADVVENLNFDTFFSAYIRADLIVSRPADREHLLRMNVLGHYYGIESFNNKSARSIGKGMNTEKLQQGLVDVRKYFETSGKKRYRGSMGLIAGLPYETIETLDNTVNWLLDNWQGHAFTLRSLSIPESNSVNKESDIAIGLDKYGYQRLTPEEIAEGRKEFPTEFAYISDSNQGKNFAEDVPWKNEYMTVFDAQRFVNKVKDIKQQYDFKPGCHAYAYRCSGDQSIEKRLQLSIKEFDATLDPTIDNYIAKKLNYKTT